MFLLANNLLYVIIFDCLNDLYPNLLELMLIAYLVKQCLIDNFCCNLLLMVFVMITDKFIYYALCAMLI